MTKIIIKKQPVSSGGSLAQRGTRWDKSPGKERAFMEFQTLFPVLRNHLSDGLDVPQYIRDLFAQITEVSEAEWGTPKDPSSRITKETTLRSYAKRGLTAKFAQSIVYRLTPDNLSDRINERPLATRQLLAADLVSYAPQVNADNVGNVVADTMVDIIRRSAGCVPLEELEAEKQRELFADLKSKFGDFLYEECDGYCPFPGCGKRLSVSTGSQITRVFDVSLVDKKKKATVTNLVALCPMCHATYQMDNSPAKTKELASVKALLSAHEESTRLLDSITLERGIVGVVKKIADLKEKDLFDAELDPKELTQKVNPAENFHLYNTVKNNVTTYFRRIRAIMTNLDKRGVIDYDEVQDQMHAMFKRLKKANKSKMEIFQEISAKVHRTSLQDEMFCRIVVCYFIQSCEVFDAAAE